MDQKMVSDWTLPPIQPAEFAKLITVMYFATWLSKKTITILSLKML